MLRVLFVQIDPKQTRKSPIEVQRFAAALYEVPKFH
jgi:hypothetical protein